MGIFIMLQEKKGLSCSTDYCFCALNPTLQYTRICLEGSNTEGYYLDGPFTCEFLFSLPSIWLMSTKQLNMHMTSR
ncbi:hypothetical protein EB796_002924 [Bugula neritina]|uniref:Uncharacterized protein n=1 Tax=Bugula neritina TaxID=10212 RepID=A0A7J7KL11_BUGNE|nr:hypothetical protein EB796_002924 [Bugula neritina]